MKRSHLLLALLLLAGPSVRAKVVYVDQSATGAVHDGTSWSTAYPTVTEGVTSAANGDEVWVARGVYGEAVTPGAGVALYGGFTGTETERSQRDWTANETVLDGAGTSADGVTCEATDITIDGFTIRGFSMGVHINLGSATVTNNFVIGNTAHGILVFHGAATVAGNRIIGNSELGFHLWGGTATIASNTISGNVAGLRIEGDGTIYNNRITGNAGFGIDFDLGGTSTFANNTVADNAGPGIASTSVDTLTIENSIVAFNGQYGFDPNLRPYSIQSFRHNDVFGNQPGDYYQYSPPANEGNISLDPLFVDRANEDFHPQPGSPCIDAGLDAAVTPGVTDLDGKPRIIGFHVDIGAYEFGTPGTPFTLADVTKCLGIFGGLESGTADDLTRLNVETNNPGLDLLDADRLARKVAGLEPNP